jgi:methylated-DNA-[protein]-cysteine S-methyltransferase
MITRKESSEPMVYTRMESPVGQLVLAGDVAGLRLVWFVEGRPERRRDDIVEHDWREDRAAFAEAVRQLQAYFAGELREFDLELAPVGTEFQLKVWRELRRIQYGSTISYGELARRMGNAKGARAVGLANGSNPLPIIVPCHRVIGGDGSLTGFGGGLPKKKWLLEMERGQGRLI